MFNVVDQLKEKHAHKSVVELVLEGAPSEGEENGAANSRMNDKVEDHFVIAEHHEEWNIISELLLDSLDLSLPGVVVGSSHRLDNKVVEGLVSVRGRWVLRGAHVFVVALQMLVKEVRVHELGIGPGSRNLVHHFSLVEQLVAADGVEAAEVAPLEAEEEVLPVGLRLK